MKFRPKSYGFLGLKSVAVPRQEISRAFLPFVTALKDRSRRRVYAFVEVGRSTAGVSTFDFLREDETAIIPVVIGRLTRKQVLDLSASELSERVISALPGSTVLGIKGFGHSLTREERRGKRFKRAVPKKRKRRAKKASRGSRKGRNSRRNKSTSKKSRKPRSVRRIRYGIHKSKKRTAKLSVSRRKG